MKPCNSANNLGVIFDKHLSMENHITSVCKSANSQLRNISQIRPPKRKVSCSTCSFLYLITLGLLQLTSNWTSTLTDK